MTTVWIHQARPRSAWYVLGSEQKDELRSRWDALNEEAEAAGSVQIGEYSIRGQSDYSTVELWRFASPEDVFDFWDRRVKGDYAVWFAFSNQIGVSTDEINATGLS